MREQLMDRQVVRNTRQAKYLKKNVVYRLLIGRYLALIETLVHKTNASSICDIGCGEGFVILHLMQKFKGRIDGCDMNRGVLSVARKLNPSVDFVQCDAAALPVRDKSYDLVLCCEVLEHLATTEQVLSEIKRVTRDYCIFSVPEAPKYQLSNMLVGKNWSRWGDDIDHRTQWTKKTFVRLIEKDFVVIQSFRSFPWLFVLARP